MNAPATSTEDLIYVVEDGIARLTFNRPQARNALTFAMYEQMAAICETVNGDHSIKAMILTGAGDKAFASGTDISQFRAFKTAQDALDYEARIDRVLGALEACRVPTIAAIAGACTGGGAGIAACCDIRIGTEATRIGFPIARTLGNCLSMSNISRLVSLVGPARTKDLIFKARLVEAPEALALGLLNEVVPDVATLQRRADETAKLVAGHAPITLEVTKEAVRRIRRTLTRDEGEDLILRAYMSEDFREGMDAFLATSARRTGRENDRGLGNFPLRPLPGSACPASDPTPLAGAVLGLQLLEPLDLIALQPAIYSGTKSLMPSSLQPTTI